MDLLKSVKSFSRVFSQKKILVLLIGFMLMQMGNNTYYMFASAYLALKYQMSISNISIYISTIGVGLAIGFAFVVKRFENKYPPCPTAITGYLLFAAGLFATSLSSSALIPWLLIIPSFIAYAVGISFMFTVFSNAVSKDHQGWVMGLSGAATWLAIGLTNILNSFMSTISINAPFHLGVLEIFVGCFIVSLVGRCVAD
jgi:MFS transporter, DHA1 family, tetracycline resistance protein